ncbi:hemolysin activation/secretion protein [Oxalobacteraceae bacterium GrIS 1.11]
MKAHRMTLPRRCQSTLLVASLFAGAAGAQTQPPTISDALRQVPPPQAPQKAAPPPLPAIGNVATEPPLKTPPGAKVEVKQFEIVGNTAIPSAELLALLNRSGGRQGQSLSLGEMEDLAGLITQHYRSKGYFVARAYLPAQEVSSGVLKIRVVEGRYGKFQLQNKSLVKDATLQGLLDDIKTPGIVSLATLERAMLNINETPGAVVSRADVMPGEQVGSSDFLVTADATARVEGYAALDNYGSVYTGKRRLTAGLSVNSPFGMGDKLTVSGLLSEGQDLQNYRLAYSALLAFNGMRGELAASRTDYTLGGSYTPLDALGKAETVEATLSYPFCRTQASALDGSLNLAHRTLRDEIRSSASVTPKVAEVATAALMARADDQWWGLPGQNTLSGALTLGNLSIDDATARTQDAAGADTRGRYGKVNLALGRSMQLQRSWTLLTSLKLQHALFGKNLDGSEDMSISGVSGVKAYPSGELAAENAALFNVELQYALPLSGALTARLGVFADAGRASMQRTVGDAGARSLSDVGVSVVANYRSLFASLQIASRTGSAARSETVSATRALLQVGASF